MALPFFYITEYDSSQKQIVLNEETSRHVVQVLRMKTGELLHLTDGKGHLIIGEIADEHKKHCTVLVQKTNYKEPGIRKISIAISLIKNTSRFEWFLEKATEIGVTEIIPLICERTEKEKFRQDRMQGICISAMLQSQQVWLPVLHEPTAFQKVVTQSAAQQKFIAYCHDSNRHTLIYQLTSTSVDLLIGIGPEGDFTTEEIEMALQNNFIPVSLGDTRLRTETAGVVAATLLCVV